MTIPDRPSRIRYISNQDHTGTTAFFRNRPLFRTVIQLIKSINKDSIRVLFHSCSVGAEVYSFLIMYLMQNDWMPELLCDATDIEPEFLERAKAAIYSKYELEKFSKEELEYFEKIDDYFYKIKKTVSGRIKFLEPVSFINFQTEEKYDIVFILNSLCYNSANDQKETINNISSYNTACLVTSAFHMDTIKEDLIEASYVPVLDNIEEIHNSWPFRCARFFKEEDRKPHTFLPLFSKIKDYEYKYCSIFKKDKSTVSIVYNEPQRKKPKFTVALFNDTGLTNHIGCKAVSDAHNLMLENIGAEIKHRFYLGFGKEYWNGYEDVSVDMVYKSDLINKLAEVDAVIVNGEGTIHHGNGLHLLSILTVAQELGKTTILVNAVFQDNEKFLKTLNRLDDFTVRDLNSSDYLSSLGINHRLILDSILEATFLDTSMHDFSDKIVFTDWHPQLGNFVGQAMKSTMKEFGDNAVFYPLDSEERAYDWRHAVSDLKRAKLIVTGRHHGIYLAGMAGVPFVALPSNTWKIEGLLKMFSKNIETCSDYSNLFQKCKKALNEKQVFKEFNSFLHSHKPLQTFQLLKKKLEENGITRKSQPYNLIKQKLGAIKLKEETASVLRHFHFNENDLKGKVIMEIGPEYNFVAQFFKDTKVVVVSNPSNEKFQNSYVRPWKEFNYSTTQFISDLTEEIDFAVSISKHSFNFNLKELISHTFKYLKSNGEFLVMINLNNKNGDLSSLKNNYRLIDQTVLNEGFEIIRKYFGIPEEYESKDEIIYTILLKKTGKLVNYKKRKAFIVCSNNNHPKIFIPLAHEFNKQNWECKFISTDNYYHQRSGLELLKQRIEFQEIPSASKNRNWYEADWLMKFEIGTEAKCAVDAMLDGENPDVIIVGNDIGTLEQFFIRSAENRNIKTVFVQEGLPAPPTIDSLGKEFLTIGNGNCDLICVWGEAFKDYLTEKRVDSKIIVTGNPRFDNLTRFVKNNTIKEKYNVLLVGQAFAKYGHITETTENKLYERIINILIERKNIHTIFKLHPQQKKDFYLNFQKELYNSFEILCEGDSLEVLLNADVMIAVSSTMGLESLYLGIPTIMLPYTINTKIPQFNDLPIVLKNEKELINVLNSSEFPQNLLLNDELQYSFIEKTLGKADGFASQRVLKAINELVIDKIIVKEKTAFSIVIVLTDETQEINFENLLTLGCNKEFDSEIIIYNLTSKEDIFEKIKFIKSEINIKIIQKKPLSLANILLDIVQDCFYDFIIRLPINSRAINNWQRTILSGFSEDEEILLFNCIDSDLWNNYVQFNQISLPSSNYGKFDEQLVPMAYSIKKGTLKKFLTDNNNVDELSLLNNFLKTGRIRLLNKPVYSSLSKKIFDEIKWHFKLTINYLKNNQYLEANNYLDRLIKIAPQNKELKYARIVVLLKLKKLDQVKNEVLKLFNTNKKGINMDNQIYSDLDLKKNLSEENAFLRDQLKEIIVDLENMSNKDSQSEYSLIKNFSTYTLYEGNQYTPEVWNIDFNGKRQQAIYAHANSRIYYKIPFATEGTFEFGIMMHPDMWEKKEAVGGCSFQVIVDDRASFEFVLDPVALTKDKRQYNYKFDIPHNNNGYHEILLETKTLGVNNNYRWALWLSPVFYMKNEENNITEDEQVQLPVNRDDGISNEIKFWEGWLINRGDRWKEHYNFRANPDSPLQEHIAELLPFQKQSVNILDVGSGPLTSLGKKVDGKKINITAVDPLADEYDKLLTKYNILPLVKTQYAKAEELTSSLKPGTFDLVYARNSLDHSENPVNALEQMMLMVNNKGVILLEHAVNEGENENYEGFHQWNFTADNDQFIIWNKQNYINVNEKLSSKALIETTVNEEKTWMKVIIKKSEALQ